MYRLTLEWSQGDRTISQTISSEQVPKFPIRIGRDHAHCDLVLKHRDSEIERTVSGLHVEIFFGPRTNCFYLRNLTRDRLPPQKPNPVMVDCQKIIHQEVPLKAGNQIKLGKMALSVQAIEMPKQLEQLLEQQVYGIKCINEHVLPYNYLESTCPYCGVALQSGQTVILSMPETS
ncbi:FHA domain-containing protein [Lyngbya aestuarii]|uniref:FHA domain-containing protein n=1 Tax=Lyngbya aestuarii TaxID=118322 RepID=UPI00403DC407